MKCQKRIPPGDDPVLSPESDCIPGRRSNQVYLNVNQFVEGGDRRSVRKPCYINFIYLNR